jgi:hypothetical protein
MKHALLSLFTVFAISAQAEQINLAIGQEKTLGSCGGSIEATESDTGNTGSEQVNLVFRKVKDCSNFDILKANGETLANYSSKKLQDQGALRGGSFTLPKKLIATGMNYIKVNLKSNSGAHSDTITVRFNAIVIPAPGGDPVVVNPPSSGSGH